MTTVELLVLLPKVTVGKRVVLGGVPRVGEYVELPGFGDVAAPVHSVIYRVGAPPILQFRERECTVDVDGLIKLGWVKL